MKVIIYTDGSARSNPGRGGYGAVLKYTNPAGKTFTSELSRGYAKTTNNRMELMAVIVALEALSRAWRSRRFSAASARSCSICVRNWSRMCASRAIRPEVHSAARAAGLRFAAIEMPMPDPQTTTPRAARPSATAAATAAPKSG